MTRILHISDLHFGRSVAVVVHALLRKISILQPDIVVISGDLTQRAKTSEFKQAAEFLNNLTTPYILVPGNHDLAAFRLVERLLYPWAKWRKYLSNDLEPTIRHTNYQIIGINTARRGGLYLDWSRGRINQQQIERIQQFFNHSAQTLNLLVAHHPFWLPTNQQHRGLIVGSNTAFQQLKDCGLDMILSGHVHLDYCRVVEGMIISHAGTTTSDRLATGYTNSFNLIEGDHLTLTISRYHWKETDFIYFTKQGFVKQDARWHEQ